MRKLYTHRLPRHTRLISSVPAFTRTTSESATALTIIKAGTMESSINIKTSAVALEKFWSPEHVTTINDSHSLKIAKIKGEFIWHSHPDTDEVFQCLSGGPLQLQLCLTAKTPEEAEERGEDKTVTLYEGDLFCIPRGVQHRPVALNETGILLIEKVGTVNTGDREGSERTVYVNEK